MRAVLDPFSLLVTALAGWGNPHQQHVIEFLTEEKTSVSDDSVDFFGNAIPARDTFLAMSYGGGLKVLRKWGPVGYRVGLRGRTLPNYSGFAYSWLEATGGLTFAWGDR